MQNPFEAMHKTNPEDAASLASMFCCLHWHGRDASAIEDQLFAVLRYETHLSGYCWGAWLDGDHFAKWQGLDGSFETSAEGFKELCKLACEYEENHAE